MESCDHDQTQKSSSRFIKQWVQWRIIIFSPEGGKKPVALIHVLVY